MKKYQIINPSDECYVLSDDVHVASAAVLLLGEGSYGMEEVGGKFRMPIFLLGGAEEWFKKETGEEVIDFLAKNRQPIKECLATFKYARERTSLNNIGVYAKFLAKKLSTN